MLNSTVATQSFHVLRRSCSCDITILRVRKDDPPQDDIATWNVPMTPDIETATKPLSFSNRFTTFYESVTC
jgi:hypothetical protein